MYRAAWIELLATNPKLSYTQLRRKLPGVHVWLYRNDRKWLEQHRPTPRKPRPKAARVDWGARDKAMAASVEAAARQILQTQQRPTRLTASLIGKQISKSSMLEQHIGRLPETATTLGRYVESREAFAVRRLHWAWREFSRLGVSPMRWQLVKKAALRKDMEDVPAVRQLLDELMGTLKVSAACGPA